MFAQYKGMARNKTFKPFLQEGKNWYFLPKYIIIELERKRREKYASYLKVFKQFCDTITNAFSKSKGMKTRTKK